MKNSGIILINKPRGLTSNAVLKKVKYMFGIKKAGHTGSLDPLATGMLPICFNEATKVCEYLLDADKCYETTGLLGIKTDSSDSTGNIIAQCENIQVSQEELQQVVETFSGHTTQIPSMYSALKHQGEPLYRLARKGLTVERAERNIFVSNIQLNHFHDSTFSLTITCSKGTYIRNIVEDIGEKLNTGAHVTELHRVYTAGFENETMYTLESLSEMHTDDLTSCLIPMDRAIMHLPELTLNESTVQAIRQGKAISSFFNDSATVAATRLYDTHRVFIGFGKQDGLELRAKRLMCY